MIQPNGFVTKEWNEFFLRLVNGDPGQLWDPTFTGLTVVGDVTYSGKWYQLGRYQAYFSVTITSEGGTSASTAGTTYIDNFPGNINADSVVLAANSTTNIGIGTGNADSADGRIYTPSWVATTDTITISGTVETR
jgi:hypothetical protein